MARGHDEDGQALLAVAADYWHQQRDHKRQVHVAARPGTLLSGAQTRKPPRLVRAAPTNKMARIFWALMVRRGVCQSPATAT